MSDDFLQDHPRGSAAYFSDQDRPNYDPNLQRLEKEGYFSSNDAHLPSIDKDLASSQDQSVSKSNSNLPAIRKAAATISGIMVGVGIAAVVVAASANPVGLALIGLGLLVFALTMAAAHKQERKGLFIAATIGALIGGGAVAGAALGSAGAAIFIKSAIASSSAALKVSGCAMAAVASIIGGRIYAKDKSEDEKNTKELDSLYKMQDDTYAGEYLDQSENQKKNFSVPSRHAQNDLQEQRKRFDKILNDSSGGSNTIKAEENKKLDQQYRSNQNEILQENEGEHSQDLSDSNQAVEDFSKLDDPGNQNIILKKHEMEAQIKRLTEHTEKLRKGGSTTTKAEKTKEIHQKTQPGQAQPKGKDKVVKFSSNLER